MRLLSVILCFYSSFVFGQWDGNITPDYPTLIKIYKNLAAEHDEIQLFQMGQSDHGEQIYLCLINAGQDSTLAFEQARSGTTLLVNNAIHPGEPDGVNACLLWIDDWIKNGKSNKIPVVAIIPAYNVGGMFNRSSSSRANQNGPEEYGFRGNAQNLDLNRDFIKMDSKNMEVFAKIYHGLDPDVFIDTHVSNGADYQYTMTYIASVRERMSPSLGAIMHDDLIPYLKNKFEKRNNPIAPYVDMKGKTPDEGIQVFNDLPRYAMGYASLFNAISFTTETHMLKPFPDRVQSTLAFIDDVIIWMSKNVKEIEKARSEAFEWDMNVTHYSYNYNLTDAHDSIIFHGFEAHYPISEVTGIEQLKYDREKPYSKFIPYYNILRASDSIEIPKYIVIGGENLDVIEKLKANQVVFDYISIKDKLEVKQARIAKFSSPNSPYEGHFLHSGIQVEWNNPVLHFDQHDVVIPMNQKNRRFIMSVLTPDSPDSYFAWNAMDSYVQQKEYFSPYVFEDHARQMLEDDEELKKHFELKKQEDEEFRKSEWLQLYYLYQRSKFYEPTHNFLPIWMLYE